MPAKQEPNIGINYGWDQGESGIHLQLDENWRAIGALLQLGVLSATADVPASPAAGDRYIVPTGATGAWSGNDGKVARFIEGAWEFYTPNEGWFAYTLDVSAWNIYRAGAWSIDASTGDMVAANNLSDVLDPAAARANIDAISATEIGDPETNFVTTFEAALA